MKSLDNNTYSEIELEEVVDDLLKKYVDLHMEKLSERDKQFFES